MKMSIYRSIQLLFIFVLFVGNVKSQEYDITFWGIPVGTAKIQQDTDNEISFKLQSHEFIDFIYPIDLEYYSKFDITDYTIIENNKTIQQGKESQDYEAVLKNNNILVYNEDDSISLEPSTHSILSLFVKLVNSPIESIDTKWSNLENEGILYETRFLWNDTARVSINNEDILCDHYRLDLKILDDENKIFEKTDYFNEFFFDINSIRQIWVEKWQKQPRIIKLTIKNNLVNLAIAIKN